jgi:DeoR/GlpR family transcriptional regulator of sugar metabolism
VVDARHDRLARLLEEHRYLPVGELCRRLQVSEATVRRDLSALQSARRITRTFGGALTEFNERFPSFQARRNRGSKGKRRIAEAAVRLIQPGMTVFIDAGTTLFAVAELFAERPVRPCTVVTVNMPVAEHLSQVEGLEVFLVAGQLLTRQSVLWGEVARKSLTFWKFDLALMGAEAFNADGIWNSREEIVALQRDVQARAARTIHCLDSGKLGLGAPHLLATWDEVNGFLTDLPPDRMQAADIPLQQAPTPDGTQTNEFAHLYRQSAATDSMPVHQL